MKDFNSKRAVWYGSRNLAVGFAKDRICQLVLRPGGLKIESMDDAVEAHQCKLTLEGAPWLFGEGDLPAMQAYAKRAFGETCRYVCSSLARLGVQALFDDTGQQYLAQFWLLLGACGAEEYVDGQELKDLLVKHPNCLGFVLEQDKFPSASMMR